VDQGRQFGVDQTVTPFRAFLDSVPGLSPGEAQQRARSHLPNRVAHSSLRWWSSDQPLPNSSQFLLVGVAVWSGYDLNLLDLLDGAVAAGSRPNTPVYIFDADACTSQEQFEAIIPGIGFVHHTPVVGYWENGKLVEKACGFHGRQIVARLFGIDEQLLHQRITAAS
jgi:hypothetical protein